MHVPFSTQTHLALRADVLQARRQNNRHPATPGSFINTSGAAAACEEWGLWGSLLSL